MNPAIRCCSQGQQRSAVVSEQNAGERALEASVHAPDQLAADTSASAAASPQRRSVALLVLTSLAVIYTLYFGSALLLPLALAAVLKLLLQPVMRVLTARLRLPAALAAL